MRRARARRMKRLCQAMSLSDDSLMRDGVFIPGLHVGALVRVRRGSAVGEWDRTSAGQDRSAAWFTFSDSTGPISPIDARDG